MYLIFYHPFIHSCLCCCILHLYPFLSLLVHLSFAHFHNMSFNCVLHSFFTLFFSCLQYYCFLSQVNATTLRSPWNNSSFISILVCSSLILNRVIFIHVTNQHKQGTSSPHFHYHLTYHSLYMEEHKPSFKLPKQKIHVLSSHRKGLWVYCVCQEHMYIVPVLQKQQQQTKLSINRFSVAFQVIVHRPKSRSRLTHCFNILN